jgi:hypothetical protein
MIGMTENTLDELVKPDKQEEWTKNVKPIWFSDDSPTGQKTPGFLKVEFTSTRGKYIGLRYAYFCFSDVVF